MTSNQSPTIVIISRKNRAQWPNFTIHKYCGRGSPLGNEFSHLNSTQHDSTKVDNRDEACNLMRIQMLRYLMDDNNLFPKSHKVKEAFNDLYRLYKQGNVLALECYCKNRDDKNGIDQGERCHTEDIKTILESMNIGIKAGKKPREVLEELFSQWQY